MVPVCGVVPFAAMVPIAAIVQVAAIVPILPLANIGAKNREQPQLYQAVDTQVLLVQQSSGCWVPSSRNTSFTGFYRATRW